MHDLTSNLLAEVDYERLIGNLGIPAVFMLVLLYGMATQGPKLVTAHLEFLETVKLHSEQVMHLQEQHSETLDRIVEVVTQKLDPSGDIRFKDHLFSNSRTNAALARYADVVEALLPDGGQTVLVEPHLRAVRQILSKE